MYACLEATKEWTSWLDNYKPFVFTFLIILTIIIYLFCVIYNAYILIINLKEKLDKSQKDHDLLNQKYEGLLNQHKIDISDKEQLLNRVALLQNLFNIAKELIDVKHLNEFNAKIDITRKVFKIEKYTDSKNN